MAKSVETLNKKLLAAAISATRASEIKALVEDGADVNCHNEWGLSPVMLAAQYNHCVAIVKALIDLGADIHEAEPKYRSNSLHLAANNSDNPKMIEVLLAAGADIDTRNYLGETALVMAVNNNEATRVATQLIKSGADVNATDYQGHSVLEYAKASGRTYLINLLKANGAV
ncbi:MAG: ankyrin repeat domain-containing protein [Sphaerochaetaceae bacterium]|nr:ankyrin repeat domain-containing protein [Sphaerochaetaceae bacterium]